MTIAAVRWMKTQRWRERFPPIEGILRVWRNFDFVFYKLRNSFLLIREPQRAYQQNLKSKFVINVLTESGIQKISINIDLVPKLRNRTLVWKKGLKAVYFLCRNPGLIPRTHSGRGCSSERRKSEETRRRHHFLPNQFLILILFVL